MSFFRIVGLTVLCIVLVAAALLLAGGHGLTERVTDWLLSFQTSLPLDLSLEHLLVAVAVAGLLVTIVVISICATLVSAMAARVLMARGGKLTEAVEARREVDRLKEQSRREYEQFLHLESLFAKRLDKQVLVQAIVESASRAGSVPQANSAASLWLLNFGNDTFTFETGIYCDQTMFVQSVFQVTDPLFAKAIHAKKIVSYSHADEKLAFLKPDKLARLGAATALMTIPLVIENTVLGMLVICCHPDALKRYEEQRSYYDAIWGAITLALAIAIQGELTIADRLTGAHSREYFMKRLIQEIDRSNRFELPLSLLMLDIDDFKAVNDTLGHPQGDAVLKIVAKLVKHHIRAVDLFGRYGGEEFIVLLPETGFGQGPASTHGVLVVAEHLRKAVEEEFSALQKPLRITLSIGAVVRRFPQDRAMGPQDLIRLADEQLYRAKTSGKNKACVALPKDWEQVPSPSPSSSIPPV